MKVASAGAAFEQAVSKNEDFLSSVTEVKEFLSYPIETYSVASTHSELRLMRSEYKLHEFVRLVLNLIHAYQFEVDRTWVIRQFATELSCFLQVKLRIWMSSALELQIF